MKRKRVMAKALAMSIACTTIVSAISSFSVSALDLGNESVISDVDNKTNSVKIGFGSFNTSGVNTVSHPITYTVYNEKFEPVQTITYDNSDEMYKNSLYLNYSEEDKGKTWYIMPEKVPYAYLLGTTYTVGETPVELVSTSISDNTTLYIPLPLNCLKYEGTPAETMHAHTTKVISFDKDIPKGLGDAVYDVWLYSTSSASKPVGLLGSFRAEDIVNGKASIVLDEDMNSASYTVKVEPRTDSECIIYPESISAKDLFTGDFSLKAPHYYAVNTPTLGFGDMPDSILDKILDSNVKYEIKKDDGTLVKSFSANDVAGGKVKLTVTSDDIEDWNLIAKIDGNVVSSEKIPVPHTNGVFEIGSPLTDIPYGDYKTLNITGDYAVGDVINSYGVDGTVFDTVVVEDGVNPTLFVPTGLQSYCIENATKGITAYVDGSADKAVFSDLTANKYVVEDIYGTVVKTGTVTDGVAVGLDSVTFKDGIYWLKYQNYDKTTKTTTVVSEVLFIPSLDKETKQSFSGTLDLNFNGLDDVADAVIMQNYLVGEEGLTAEQYAVLAYNGFIENPLTAYSEFKQNNLEDFKSSSGKPELLPLTKEDKAGIKSTGDTQVFIPSVSMPDTGSAMLKVCMIDIPEEGLAQLGFSIKYDNEMFDIESCNYDNLAVVEDETGVLPFKFYNDKQKGILNCYFAPNEEGAEFRLYDEGVLFTINGAVNDKAKAGDIITFDITDITGDADVSYTSGQIEIVEPIVTTTTTTTTTITTTSTTPITTTTTIKTTTPIKTTTSTTTTTTPVLTVTRWGDANCSGTVDIADVVAIAGYVGNPEGNTLTEQGLINADVHNVGDGLSAGDVLAIQQFIAGIVPTLPIK